MKSRRNDVESVIKLVVSSDDDGHDGSTTKGTSATSDRHRQRVVYEFYSGNANVTPREINSVRYPMKLCGETPCKNRILSTTHTYGWSHDNYDDYFLKIDSKSVDDLLDDVLSYKRQRFDREQTYETKYDVGPDIAFPGENTVAIGYEVELTESPTFHISNVPNTVTVEGDGDHERTRKANDVYRDNCAGTRAKTDTVTQTVKASADRRDEVCQTTARSVATVGTQLDGFDVVDGTTAGNGRRDASAAGTPSTDHMARAAMFVVRIAAQNSLMATAARTGPVETASSSSSARVRLDYRFALTRNDGGGPAVRCTRWNEAQTHLLAVAYGGSMGDGREDAAAAVAVWSTKNPYAPERFYEFDESAAAITCLRFSIEHPNRLAVGFDSGEILIVDICNERLEIVFRKSKQSPLGINGIVGLFWTVRLENGLSRVKQFECLVTCNSRGGIERYRYWNETFERKTVCENDSLAENDERPTSNATGYSKAICHATTFHGLDHNAYLVGTGDGAVYTCGYDDSLRCRSTKAIAHFGVIRSLEKSPHSPDVYLTTGCDGTVKIWMGDIFVEPVITLSAGGQVEKAVWSRTSPTIVVTIVDNRLHVWDMGATTDAPVAVHETLVSSDRARCSDAEFTSDGGHLCVSDTDGNAMVYAWSDAAPPSARQTGRHCGLMRCVARSLRGKTYLIKTLSEQRPEYADVFAAVRDER